MALNVDPREAEPARISPEDFQAAVTRLKDAGGSETRVEAPSAGGSPAPLAVWPGLDGAVAGGGRYRGEQDGLTYGSRSGHSRASRSRPRAVADAVAASRGRAGRGRRRGGHRASRSSSGIGPTARRALFALTAIAGDRCSTLAALVWGLLPLRRRPTDRQVARFIEEREPSLDDRLVTAVRRAPTRPRRRPDWRVR